MTELIGLTREEWNKLKPGDQIVTVPCIDVPAVKYGYLREIIKIEPGMVLPNTIYAIDREYIGEGKRPTDNGFEPGNEETLIYSGPFFALFSCAIEIPTIKLSRLQNIDID